MNSEIHISQHKMISNCLFIQSTEIMVFNPDILENHVHMKKDRQIRIDKSYGKCMASKPVVSFIVCQVEDAERSIQRDQRHGSRVNSSCPFRGPSIHKAGGSCSPSSHRESAAFFWPLPALICTQSEHSLLQSKNKCLRKDMETERKICDRH